MIGVKMEREKIILNEIEKTLNSYDNDILLKENPYLSTRIFARLKTGNGRLKKTVHVRLSLNKAILVLALLINLVTIVLYYQKGSGSNLQEKMAVQLEEDFKIEESQNIY
jgi:hypothetical protein